VPRIASDTGSRISERLVLQSLGGNSDVASVGKEALAVRRNEVRERSAFPHVAMEPEAAVHGVDHSIAPEAEFAKWHLVWSVEVSRRMLLMRVAHA
jgi:hypothetical protein